MVYKKAIELCMFNAQNYFFYSWKLDNAFSFEWRKLRRKIKRYEFEVKCS